MLRQVVAEQFERFNYLAQRRELYDRRSANFQAGCALPRLLKIEGIGPLSATALVAATERPRVQKRAPLQRLPGTGARSQQHRGQDRDARITKRGNRYLRTLLIHGGRSAVYAARRHTNPRSVGLIASKRGHNVAAVALANKNARVAWAILRYGEDYCPVRAHRQPASPAAARTAWPAETLAGTVHSAHPARQTESIFSARPQPR